MNSDNVSWLTTVPASDCNFKSHLQSATVKEIHEALHIMTGKGKRGNSTRIAECSKELYPAIAEKNNTTPSRTERAIRHAFEVVRSYKGNPDVVNHYIGMENCENSSSLKTLYIRIKQECEETEKKECVEEVSKWESGKSITALEIREIIRQELRAFLDELKAAQT